jgi:hypothetical protein
MVGLWGKHGSGSRCGNRARPGARARRGVGACKRAITRGRRSFTRRTRLNELSFQGRISRRQKLKPGQLYAHANRGQHQRAIRVKDTRLHDREVAPTTASWCDAGGSSPIYFPSPTIAGISAHVHETPGLDEDRARRLRIGARPFAPSKRKRTPRHASDPELVPSGRLQSLIGAPACPQSSRWLPGQITVSVKPGMPQCDCAGDAWVRARAAHPPAGGLRRGRERTNPERCLLNRSD